LIFATCVRLGEGGAKRTAAGARQRAENVGGAAGRIASYAAAAGAQSRLPVNRISDLQKF
jgi:hypothetical protein